MSQSSSASTSNAGNNVSIGNRNDPPPPPLIPVWAWISGLVLAVMFAAVYLFKKKKS